MLSETSSARLLSAARRGRSSALDRLLTRQLPRLRRWAHGRLPRWARSIADTADLIQDALLRTLGRLDTFEPRGRHALAAYLREAVRNRIRDEHRRVGRRGLPSVVTDAHAGALPSPFDAAVTGAMEARYRAALGRMTPVDRELIVARFEMGLAFDDVAVATGRPTAAAARMAVTRAMSKLAAELNLGR